MKEILLTQNKSTIVDDEDYEYLNQFKWCLNENKQRNHLSVSKRPTKKESTKSMHRLIMNAQPGEYVDHINRNPLDNRKCNLRLCSNSQNTMNRCIASNNTSGFKGVCFNKKEKRWTSTVRTNGIRYFCGYHDTAIKAALAYDKKARELFKEFTYTNFGSPNSPYILITS